MSKSSPYITQIMEFTADDCSWIVCPLDVLNVDDAHLMRQKMALLKSAASMLPVIYPKSVSKIEPERLPCLPPGADKILKPALPSANKSSGFITCIDIRKQSSSYRNADQQLDLLKTKSYAVIDYRQQQVFA